MRRTRSLRVAIAFGSLVFIALAAGGLYFHLKQGCANRVPARFPSPDGKLEAITFGRDCGATTGSSTQVSIVRMGDALPDAPGNVVAADANGGKAPAGPGGGPELRVSWWGNELRVWHHRQARITPAAPPRPLGVSVRLEAFD